MTERTGRYPAMSDADWDGMDRRADGRREDDKEATSWHIKREVTPAQLITLITAVLAIAGWLFTLDKQIAVNTTDISHLQTSDIHIEAREREDMSRIEAALARIESKVDKK